MSIVCSVTGHAASSTSVWNDGYHFSTCTRCGVDLVECENGRWMQPPRGYRIVRKKRQDGPGSWRALEGSAPSASVDEEAAREPTTPLQEKRGRKDRRVNSDGALPAALEGVDRRRADRRKSSGNYQMNRRKGLVAR